MGQDVSDRGLWLSAVSPPVAVLLGAPVDDVTVSEAVDLITAMVAAGRAGGRVHQVVTVNVDFIVNAQGDAELLRILQRSDLAIPDGMPVVWGSRLLGTGLRERATGVELLPALVERAAAAGYRVCLFGGAPGVAERAAEMLTARYSGAAVVGLEAPSIGLDGTMDPAEFTRLRAADPDILGVALGNPKQEHWIARHGTALGFPVFIGIGGTLDFLTGVTKRAPMWMQKSGLEWFHRAMSEPRRLAARYARDFVVFGPRLAVQAWRGRDRGTHAVQPTLVADSPITRIDLSGVPMLDNRVLADIVGHVRQARRRDTPIELVGANAATIESVRRLGADGVLDLAT